MQKVRKILRTVSEKTALPTNQPNIEVSDFGLIWRHFREYLQIKIFFQKSGSVTFLPLWFPNLMQKIPTNYYQQHRPYKTSLTPVQQRDKVKKN